MEKNIKSQKRSKWGNSKHLSYYKDRKKIESVDESLNSFVSCEVKSLNLTTDNLTKSASVDSINGKNDQHHRSYQFTSFKFSNNIIIDDNQKEYNTNKPNPLIKTKSRERSLKLSNHKSAILPQDGITLVNNFEKDFSNMTCGMKEKEWFNEITIMFHKSSTIPEDLLKTFKTITKNTLHCVAEIINNESYVIISDTYKSANAKGTKKTDGSAVIASINAADKNKTKKENGSTKKKEVQQQCNNNSELIRTKFTREEIFGKYSILSIKSMHITLGLFFFNANFIKATKKEIEKKKSTNSIMMTNSLRSSSNSILNTSESDIASSASMSEHQYLGMSIIDIEHLRDKNSIDYKYKIFLDKKGYILNFLIVLVNRLVFFCKFVSLNIIYNKGHHSKCTKCQDKSPRINRDNLQKDYNKTPQPTTITTKQSTENESSCSRECMESNEMNILSILFSIILKDTLYLIENLNIKNHLDILNVLSDPQRTKNKNKYQHFNESDHKYSNKEKKFKTPIYGNRSNLLERQKSDPSHFKKSKKTFIDYNESIENIKNKKTKDGHFAENDNEKNDFNEVPYSDAIKMCQFIVYGKSQDLFEIFNKISKTDAIVPKSIFFIKNKKSRTYLNVQDALNILHMHPYELWKILKKSNIFKTTFYKKAIANDILDIAIKENTILILKCYIMLLLD